MNYYICFELISNTYLYNIVFVNNFPPQLKNSGSATGKNYILNLLENTLYDVYNSIDNAKALRESLDQKYKAKDVDLTKLLVCKFVEFKMVDVRIIISQVQDFKLIPHGIYIEEMVTNEYF